MVQHEIRELMAEELVEVSGGAIANLLKGVNYGISPAIDAFLNGYYTTCGCNSGHTANWSEP